MKVLITGGAGFIGKWVVAVLPPETEIFVIDLLNPQAHSLQDFAPELRERAVCIKVDVRNVEAYREIAEGTDVFIHLASQTGTGQSMYEISRYIQHNIDGTAKLLELISTLKQKPSRFILSSSRAVYGEGAFSGQQGIYYPGERRLHSLPMRETQITTPTSVYGLTKLWQEQLVQNYCKSQDMDSLILRLQNVYGSKQALGNPYTGIIGIFTNAILQKNAIELFEDGLMTRYFVFVKDVAKAIFKGVFHQQRLETIVNIGSGEETTLKKLIQTLSQLTSKDPTITLLGRFRIGDIRHAVADMDATKQSLESGCLRLWRTV